MRLGLLQPAQQWPIFALLGFASTAGNQQGIQAGSALALTLLRELEWQPESSAKKHVVGMVKQVAEELRNTPAVCRKCYIHPALIEAFHAGELSDLRLAAARKGLRSEESLLMRFLEKLPVS